MSVLFLGVASPMAEGLARARFGDRIQFLSAAVDEIDPAGVDLVITLGDDVVCPASLAPARRLHWPIPDPTIAVAGESEHMRQHRFRAARLAIEPRLEIIESALTLPPRTVVSLATPDDRAELESLLTASGFSTQGFDDTEFSIARLDGVLFGTAGLERWGAFGLLRSTAVTGNGHTAYFVTLVRERVCAARLDGLSAVYHQRTDSIRWFERIGFAVDDRAKLRDAIPKSTQLEVAGTALKLSLHKESTDVQLTAAVGEELAAHGTLVPLWVKYPQIPRASIGWRMGGGEWYAWMFQHWWAGLDDATRAAYRARWVPQGEWADWW